MDTVVLTQLGALLMFVGVLFVLYRRLVSAKDATIESLTVQVAGLERDLQAARAAAPDALAQALQARVSMFEAELARLLADRSASEEAVSAKEAELAAARERLERFLALAQEIACPGCGAGLIQGGLRS